MRLSTLMIGAGLLLGAAGLSTAGEVNCKFVLKNLSLPGRTVKDVSEQMQISEADIKKCQDEAASKPAEGGGMKAGESGDKK
jgi:hypothetical protein